MACILSAEYQTLIIITVYEALPTAMSAARLRRSRTLLLGPGHLPNRSKVVIELFKHGTNIGLSPVQ